MPTKTEFSISVYIEAAPDVVWSVMRDVERWPEWTSTVTKVRLLDPGPLAIGRRAVIHQPKLPPAPWTVTALDDAGRSFTWVSSSPLSQVTARHRVEALTGGSRAHLAVQFSGLLGGFIARLTRNLNERYLAIEAQGLKQRSETAPRIS